MDRDGQFAEIDRNYDAFRRGLATYLRDHSGEYALMKDGKVIDFFKKVEAAAERAAERFGGTPYSIQQVVEDPIDLGFFSHAGR